MTLTVEQNLLVFAHLYRIPRAERRAAIERALGSREPPRPPRHARRQALGRHAPAAADRARARAPAAARAARRADRRPRPAGAPGAVGADRRAAHRGRLDPDVDALHRGGPAARRHRDDHVPRQGRRRRAAGRRSSPSTRAPRRSRSTGRRRGWPRSRRDARAQGLRTRRTGTSIAVLGNGHGPTASAGRPTSRTCSCCSPGRRSVVERSPARAPGAERRARARDHQLLLVLAVDHVLVDRRADDLPARVRLRLRLAGHDGRRLRLRPVRGHRHGRHRGAVLERLPGHVRDVRQVPVPAHLRRDPRRAGRHRGARHRRGAVDRARAPACTAACRCSWPWSSGSTPRGACSSSRSSASWPASAGARAGSWSPGS